MSEQLWRRVAERLAEHSYMAGVERTVERVRATGEIFTPSELVIEMLQYLDLDLISPGKSVLDPACGDGQFLVAAKWVKVYHHGMSVEEALGDLYGVDIMRDNVDLCRRRLGGGTIVMGDSLQPSRRLEGQRAEEWELMLALFQGSSTSTYKKARIRKAKPRQSSRSASGPAEARSVGPQGDPQTERVEEPTLF
jgi:SAM-dependent methyltransferase